MYLKKVEIRGFKSFADLVQVEVPRGITAVIGPNGCGKSNIADAMRWVLGEQSAKLLRGETMQDVIFSGTQNRKGLGYAQVSMTIDNTAGRLKIDYSEVVVTRRVYRSGESEYLINKSPCRLKDIHEIFMGTGVGKEGYSIIGQGQIDKILSSKPDDRRTLFEEAAGVYKYKLRKEEAEKKLDNKQENLIRIQDILMELESRIESLEKQAKKAKNYLDIRDELKEIEANIFILEADKIEKELSEFTKAYKILEADYATNKKELKKAKIVYDEIRGKLISLQEESTSLQNEISDIRMEIEKHEGSINVHLERINAIDEGIKRIQNDNQKRKIKTSQQESEQTVFQARLAEIQKERDLEEEELDSLEEELGQITSDIADLEDASKKDKTKMYQLMSQVSDMKANIDKGGTLTEQIKIRQEQITDLIKQITRDIKHQEARRQVLKKQQEQSKTHHTCFSKEKDTLQTDLHKLDQVKEKINQKKKETQDLYHQSHSRHNVLSQMKNEYEGFYKSVKNIMNLKQRDPVKWENIHGVIGEIIRVPKQYETAINVALGNSIQHIVTKDEQTANIIIDYIKKHKLGRATFLPLTSVKGRCLGGDANSIPTEVGVIGLANTLVNYDPTYRGIISSLLGRVILVDNMNHAIILAKKYNYRYRIVTLEGEILNPGGSITGGNFHQNRGNIFSRNREVKELKLTMDQAEKTLEDIAQEEKQFQIKYDKNLSQLTEKTEKIVEVEKQQIELRIQINNIEEALKQNKQQKLSLEEERNEIDKNSKQMDTDIDGYREFLKAYEEEIKVLEMDTEALSQKIQLNNEKKDLIASKMTDHKVSLSSKKEIFRSIEEQIQRIKQEIINNKQENKTYDQQIENNLKQKEKLNIEIQEFKDSIEGYRSQLRVMQSKLDKTNQDKKDYTVKENNKKLEQEQKTESNLLLQTEIYSIENKVTKINLQKENIFQKIWDEYEMTYEIALKFKKDLGSVTSLRQAAKTHRGDIRKLGTINAGAIEEYDETKERYDFMRKHEQDILKAEETLLRLIDELTKSMETIFKEEFEKISRNFNIVFTELFGGGQAFLELSDEDNVLESGIEIIAQPPGKKLQNMMLLSGGERALTAIAILFGILRLKPSPFAVLDEIEAALDDANVLRFANYLKRMGEKMQFIMITHRKGTMEAADTIYGVTMEEQGVSKIISVQLDEVEDYEQTEAR